jgi:hypothetical protein
MHYHMEVIMPPTNDVEGVLKKVLEPFNEGADEEVRSHPFWDWYQVGGRYAGSKVEARVTPEEMDKFMDALKELRVTVSSLQWGKQELSPASQIPAVDALWREMCPNGGPVCTVFKHSGNAINGDVCKLQDMPPNLTAFTVAVVTEQYDGAMGVESLWHKEIWNGATHQDTAWRGSVSEAIKEHTERVGQYKEDARNRYTPKPDWLVVTVDYHS